MNLGEGPQFIAIKVNWLTVNKLNSILTAKYHLRNDFFKFGGSDPSQQHIIFHLTGPISPHDVVNIYEVSDSTELKLSEEIDRPHVWLCVHGASTKYTCVCCSFWMASMV